MKLHQNREAGFTMIAVLVVMGVVMTALMMVSRAKIDAKRAQKHIKAKQSYSDINQALINDLVLKINTDMTASCMDPWSAIQGRDLDGKVSYSASRQISFGQFGEVPQKAREAMGRCSERSRWSNNNEVLFCVQIATDASNNSAADSIVGARRAFAEVKVELTDFHKLEKINCSQYFARKTGTDQSEGLTVTMNLFWETPAGAQQSLYSQKALSYIANMNDDI